MNVALCISGLVRTLDQCVESMSKYLIEPTGADVFVNVWEEDPNKEKVSLLKPVVVNVAKMPNWNMDRNDRIPIANNPMFFGISMCNVLRQNYERKNDMQYDWVIRARADEMFYEGIEDLNTLDRKFMYFPNFNNYYGLNDRFAFSSPELMDIYCGALGYNINNHYADYEFDRHAGRFFDRVTKKTIYMASEFALAKWLVMHNVEIRRTKVIYEIIRLPGSRGSVGMPIIGDKPDIGWEELKERYKES